MIAELVENVRGMIPGRVSYKLDPADVDSRAYRADDDTRRIRDGFDNEEQALHTMQRIWEEGRARSYHHLQACERNTLFFLGKHWAIMPDPAFAATEDLYRFSFPDISDSEVRTTANLIRKHFLGWVSRMTRNMPRVKFTPFSTDDDDKDRADILNKIAQAEAAKTDERRFILEAFIAAGLWRSAFMLSEWDETAGDMIHPLQGMGPGDLEMLRDPEMGPQVYGEDYADLADMDRRGMRDEDMQPEGALCNRIIPSWAITVINPHDVALKQVPFIMYSEVRTRAWVKEHYPEIDHERMVSLDGDSAWAHQLHFLQNTSEDLLGELNGGEDETDGRNGEPLDTFQRVLVHTAYMRPNRDRKRGRKIVTCGQVMAKLGDNPYWHGDLPLTQFAHTLNLRTLFGDCDFDHAVEVQFQIDQTLSHLIQNRNLAANPQILDNGSGVDWENTLNVPNEVLFNQPGRVPQRMEVPNMPAYIGNMVPELRFIQQELFDDHTPTQGVSRAGDSGVKTRLLQQAGEVRLATTAEIFAEAYTNHWVQRVCNLAQYQEHTKTAYVMGDMYDRQYFSWDRAALIGEAARSELDIFADEGAGRAMVLALKQRLNCQVLVQPGKSLTTVREDMSNLQQIGLINPQNIQQYEDKLWEMYGYNFEADDIMAEKRRHASKAGMENDLLERGTPLPSPMKFERHDIHIEVHTRFANTRRFEQMDPMLQQALISHIELHKLGIAKQPIEDAYIQQWAQIEMMQQYGPLVPMGAAAGAAGQPGQNPAGGPPESVPAGQ